jgi:1-acyl-sn-glycerol-3-phosphate acyltransferase
MWATIAKWILKLNGWTMVGEIPLKKKAVIIAAPHTSNWDGIWALVYKVAKELDVHWFAKESLFWFPLGSLLRLLGGIPLDRKRAGSAVDYAVEVFRDSDEFYFGLAPEGTRSRADYWKTGFYRIAEAADVPVVLGFLDYGSKRVGIGPVVELSGDHERDLAILRDFYDGIEGRRPEQTGPIELPPQRRTNDTKKGRD